jgi:CRISPR/Cas system-associated protein Cas7 (RAMP superfamily)
MKYTYKKMANGGRVDKDKGYTAKDRKALKSLIEEFGDKYSKDVTGSGSVTFEKKKKAPPKKMARGGIVGKPARSARDMKAGAGSGVGRIQKTKIQRGR